MLYVDNSHSFQIHENAVYLYKPHQSTARICSVQLRAYSCLIGYPGIETSVNWWLYLGVMIWSGRLRKRERCCLDFPWYICNGCICKTSAHANKNGYVWSHLLKWFIWDKKTVAFQLKHSNMQKQAHMQLKFGCICS